MMTDTTLLPDLLSLRELLAVPERWTQGTYARNENGNPVEAASPNACAWCLSGAFRRVVGFHYGPRHNALSDVLAEIVSCENIPDWQDAPSRTHSEVLALIDKAIEAARAAHTTT